MKYSTIWGRSIYIVWTNCHYMSLVIIKYNTYINFCFRFCRIDFITQWHTEKKNDYWKLRKQKIIKTLHSSTLFLHTVIVILGTIDAVQSKRWLYIYTSFKNEDQNCFISYFILIFFTFLHIFESSDDLFTFITFLYWRFSFKK